MPIDIDLMKHKFFAREYRRGVQEGELTILRRQIEKRFGTIPAWAEERLTSRSTAELEDLSDRILDAASLEDLLN